MKKRWLSCALALTMSSSLFVAGCNNGKNDDGDVEGKTTIRVATYNGGLGLDWLRDAALRFEKAYENMPLRPLILWGGAFFRFTPEPFHFYTKGF